MSLTRSAHRQAFMLEIEIQNYLHPPLLCGGFKRRTKRCDRYCREILHELKLIQGLITVKTGLHERRLLSSLTETRAWREKKKLHHLSFYIYKLRNLQWERGKYEKRFSKRRILFTAGTAEIVSVDLSCNINLITSNEKYLGDTAHTHTLLDEEINLENTFSHHFKHIWRNSLAFWKLWLLAFLLAKLTSCWL